MWPQHHEKPTDPALEYNMAFSTYLIEILNLNVTKASAKKVIINDGFWKDKNYD